MGSTEDEMEGADVEEEELVAFDDEADIAERWAGQRTPRQAL